MSPAPLIVGAACRFASGPNLALADCALRSNLALPIRHPFYVDRGGARVRVSAMPELGADYSASRHCALAKPVLDELADTLTLSGVLPSCRQRCSLWLLLPPAERPGISPDLPERMQSALADERFGWQSVYALRGGHAAGIHAMALAAQHSRDEGVLSVVLAADGWGHPSDLKWLEERRLVHGSQALHEGSLRGNPYGRVPGEAAAAVALLPGVQTTRQWAPPAGPTTNGWATLSGTALAAEHATFDSQAPCLGRGLAQAAQQACDAAQVEAGVTHLSTDFNGEPYRGDELGFATLALGGRLSPGWRRRTPALCSGDVGSASAVLHVALAAFAMHQTGFEGRQQSTGPTLVLASSDDTLRGAAVLTSALPA